MEDVALLDLAASLCDKAGLSRPVSLTRLAGGKNNRVFRVALSSGADVVLKSYFHDPRDTRDRLKAEWSFLTYAWGKGVRNIPAPLASDAGAHAGLYSLLPGAMLDKAEPAHVEAAARFICAVNAAPREIDHLPLGSEACLSIAQHVATVSGRVARLETIATDAPHRDAAVRLIADRLKPAWAQVSQNIEAAAAAARLDMEAIPAGDVIASPSDFGFHNALADADGALRFIDFEYAGRDDPAKLAGDFFAVPAIPTPSETFEMFIGALSDGLSLSPGFAPRARMLRDAYRIKWTCIILNDFLPTEDARRAFSLGEDRAERCRRQLDRAGAKLDEIDA